MKFLVEKDTKLRQEQFILEKQIELFSQEITVLKENYKDCNWKINKDFCQSIIKIEKAPALFLNMVYKLFPFESKIIILKRKS